MAAALTTLLTTLRRRFFKPNVIIIFLLAYLLVIITDEDKEALDDNRSSIKMPWEMEKQNRFFIDPQSIDLTTRFHLNSKLSCQNRNNQSSRTEVRSDKYLVLYNHIVSDVSVNCNASVTYTTHATYDYLKHLFTLLERWEGVISVAVYAPDYDYKEVIDKILHFRQCVTDSGEVKAKPVLGNKFSRFVSFHIYFDLKYKPVKIFDPQELKTRKIDCSKKLTKSNEPFRAKSKMDYPINVARNVARIAANTYYILPSDVELLPNPGLVSKFLAMVHQNKPYLKSDTPRVFVLPIFEIKRTMPLPANKSELIRYISHRNAVIFHYRTCPKCQRIPGHTNWTTTHIDDEDMNVLLSAKRVYPFNKFWEPIYICSHEAPLYSERLSWEGRRDKMTQALELCLLDYDFSILTTGFLVHRGIKSPRSATLTAEWQHKIYMQNRVIIGKIVPEIHKRLGFRQGCSPMGKMKHY